MQSRDEHLAWCKKRALEILDSGDIDGARASMISDLQKWQKPLYQPEIFQLVCADGVLFCKTAAQMRHWIEGFN